MESIRRRYRLLFIITLLVFALAISVVFSLAIRDVARSYRERASASMIAIRRTTSKIRSTTPSGLSKIKILLKPLRSHARSKKSDGTWLSTASQKTWLSRVQQGGSPGIPGGVCRTA